MSGSKLGDKLEELDLSPEEIHRLTEAMKKKEFRDLLAEYAKEIQDPENKKKYEEEIRMMESERGVDVKFITPTPGYVIKTVQNGDTKCFINICYSNTIDKATCTKSAQRKGEHWSIPYSTAAGREDVDKAGSQCVVYDCVFHEETYNRGLKDSRFKKLIHDTALQGIESQLKVTLDKVNLKFPKLKFKGMVQPTMIRRKKTDEEAVKEPASSKDNGAAPKTTEPSSKETTENIQADEPENTLKDVLNFPYPYPVPGEEHPEPEKSAKKTKKEEKASPSNTVEYNGKMYTVPDFTIVHRGYTDMQTCVDMVDSKMHVTRPKELVVQITLPLLTSAKTVSLDVLKKQLLLHTDTPAAYRLDIVLPYPVEEEKGSARFDKSKRKLIVVLPVTPPDAQAAVSIPIEDQQTVLDSVYSKCKGAKNKSLVEEINGSNAQIHGSSKANPGGCENGSRDNEKSPTESVDEINLENMSYDELPEADQATRSDAKPKETGKTKLSKKHNFEKGCEKFFEDFPAPVLKIPPDLERQLDAMPDDWFQSKSSKISTQSQTGFPTDPFLYEVDIPQYAFTQRLESLTIVIKEKQVRSDLMEVKPFKNGDGLHIRFCAIDEDMSSKWFYIYVDFDPTSKNAIDRNSIETDVTEMNCVILLQKAEHCRKIWSILRIGPCKDSLKVEYLDLETEFYQKSRDLKEEYRPIRLPMHVENPVFSSDKLTLTLKPGKDPREFDENDEGVIESDKFKSSKYSKTADEISALIQSGKLDEAIAKEIEMEQEKEMDDLLTSKDDVMSSNLNSGTKSQKQKPKFGRDQKDLETSMKEFHRDVEKFFPKSKGVFDDERFLLNKEFFNQEEESIGNLEPSPLEDGYINDEDKSHDDCVSDEKKEESCGGDGDDDDPQHISSSADKAQENGSSKNNSNSKNGSSKSNESQNQNQKGKNNKNGDSKQQKKKKQKQKSPRARLMSHSSDDEQTRVNTYENVVKARPTPLDTSEAMNIRCRRGSSSNNTSPSPSPRSPKGANINVYSSSFGNASCEESSEINGSARPIIKRSCRTEDESETDHGSLRKSVSFCEDVDVVNIKTMPTKAGRQSNKKSKKKQKRGFSIDDQPDDKDEEATEGGRAPAEVHEQATWNKIPLSTVPLTFDLD